MFKLLYHACDRNRSPQRDTKYFKYCSLKMIVSLLSYTKQLKSTDNFHILKFNNRFNIKVISLNVTKKTQFKSNTA